MIYNGASIDDDEWPWEAMAIFELFPDTVLVGGNVHSNNKIINNMCYQTYSYDTCMGTDNINDSGYFAHMWKQHSVYAVSSCHAVVKANYLCEVIDEINNTAASIECLGSWLSAIAYKRGHRVVYSPFFSVSLTNIPDKIKMLEYEKIIAMFGKEIEPNKMKIFNHRYNHPDLIDDKNISN